MNSESAMSTEALVAPDAATEIPASEAVQTPEVTDPEASAETQPDEPQEPDPRDKAVKSLNRRVDRITAARYQAEARAQQASQEAEQLRQRLAQYEQGETPQPRQQDPLALANEIATIREVTAKSNAVAKDGEKRFEGFGKAVSVVIEEAGPLVVPIAIAPGQSIGKPTPLGEAILDSEDPAAVLHYLGNNPDAAADLHGLTATQVARRIARIELEIGKAKEPKQSNAPKPITPVKSAAKDDGGLSDNLPPEEWAKRFRKMRREG